MPKKQPQKQGRSGSVPRNRRWRGGIQMWEVALVVVLAVLAAGGMAAINAKGAQKATPSATIGAAGPSVSATPAELGPAAKTKGSADAKVTIVEYADFQ